MNDILENLPDVKNGVPVDFRFSLSDKELVKFVAFLVVATILVTIMSVYVKKIFVK